MVLSASKRLIAIARLSSVLRIMRGILAKVSYGSICIEICSEWIQRVIMEEHFTENLFVTVERNHQAIHYTVYERYRIDQQ